MHEFVARRPAKAERDVSAMDVAKRLLDYGFHPPTVYFPLIVREAMMIEPTETESKATLDAFRQRLGADHRGVARAIARGPARHAHLPARRGGGGAVAGAQVEGGKERRRRGKGKGKGGSHDSGTRACPFRLPPSAFRLPPSARSSRCRPLEHGG